MKSNKTFSSIFLPYLHLVICDAREFANWSAAWRYSEKENAVARTVRGKKCSTAKELFNEFGAALQFPYYFGENWDAFNDCITDLEWIPGNEYLLFIPNAEKVLANADRDFRIFIDLLHKAGKEWAESQEDHPDFPRPSKPFHVVFHCEPDSKNKLLNRLNEVNAEFSEITID